MVTMMITVNDLFFGAEKKNFFPRSSLRRWNLHSGQCLSEMYGHQAYVYR